MIVSITTYTGKYSLILQHAPVERQVFLVTGGLHECRQIRLEDVQTAQPHRLRLALVDQPFNIEWQLHKFQNYFYA